ncbi:hypothetical protein C3K23_18550 [Streptomyces sp. 604F]|nr:hypothetical protein C3K23_18550 [Streptomyces sp. 604F]
MSGVGSDPADCAGLGGGEGRGDWRHAHRVRDGVPYTVGPDTGVAVQGVEDVAPQARSAAT